MNSSLIAFVPFAVAIASFLAVCIGVIVVVPPLKGIWYVIAIIAVLSAISLTLQHPSYWYFPVLSGVALPALKALFWCFNQSLHRKLQHDAHHYKGHVSLASQPDAAD